MTSSQDQMFTTAVSRTPEPLLHALQQSGLASAGVLRNFKRDSALTLKLDPEDKGTASRAQLGTTARTDGTTAPVPPYCAAVLDRSQPISQ